MEAVDGGTGARRGVAATGRCLAPYANDRIGEELMDKLRSFMGSLGYTGLFDIDLIETTDGSIYFVELNLRSGASAYVHLAGIYADHKLKGADVPDEDELKQRCAGSKAVTFASEKVLLEEYGDGNIGEKEFEDAIHSADVHFIMDKSDIMPYRKFMNAFHKIRKKQTK